MSLRIRLILAFLAIVLMMAGVGVFSFHISRQVHQRVADLTHTSIAEFERSKSLGQALEVEGYWREDHVFVAREIEKIPRPRRPKLRGPIEAVDRDKRQIQVYGIPIVVDASTEFIDVRGVVAFESLREGLRLEVSCSIDDDGQWVARKIRTSDLKPSDKIKGTITDVAMDGVAPDSIDISGITIILGAENRSRDPGTDLGRISLVTRMALAAQDCMVAAQHVLAGESVTKGVRDDEAQDSRTLLMECVGDLGFYIDQARASAEAAASKAGDVEALAAGPRDVEVALWLIPLAERQADLDAHVVRFLELVEENLESAKAYFFTTLEPFLHNEILPMIQAYQIEAEGRLALEVESISAQAGATTRALIITSLAGLVIAMTLGFALWRSISKPLLMLTDAAEQIGHGRLDTRVAVKSNDELGVLARAFNHMAGELTVTTVSIANLNNIIDSMAGALIVIDSDGTIVSVNKATLAMLGYDEDDLTGQPFGSICVEYRGGQGPPVAEPGFVAIEERTFRRKDGTKVPVSFSGAVLRSEGGPPQGFVCVAQDLTERRNMEERLRQSLGEKELLLREVHHRVKNNLQVISSLLDLQSSYVSDSGAPDKLTDSQNRIRSMALIHEQLYRATDLDKIDFKAYLELLTTSLFHSYGGQTRPIKLHSNIAPVRMDIDQALSCGLIINEVVTNSLKHAFPDGATGTVTIEFANFDDVTYELTVSDDGRGMPGGAKAGETDSLGMSLVSALVGQLAGEMKIETQGGTTFRIRFPTSPDGVLKS